MECDTDRVGEQDSLHGGGQHASPKYSWSGEDAEGQGNVGTYVGKGHPVDRAIMVMCFGICDKHVFAECQCCGADAGTPHTEKDLLALPTELTEARQLPLDWMANEWRRKRW